MAPRNQYWLQFFFRKGYVCADVRWGEKQLWGRSLGSLPIPCWLHTSSPTRCCCLLLPACCQWQCGKLVPFLVSKPDGLVPPCRRPVRAIAAPHTATQVMWESRGLRPAVTYHILLPFGAVDRRSPGASKKTCSGNQTITCCCSKAWQPSCRPWLALRPKWWPFVSLPYLDRKSATLAEGH